MAFWQAAAASVTGDGHKRTGTPCQDSSVVLLDPTGNWLVAVASDGAGTATRAQEGAKFVTDQIASALLRLAAELESRAPGVWINDFVIQSILDLRSKLRQAAGSETLQDFNCTLVGCLVGKNGGFAIHIGDGAAFAGNTISENRSSAIQQSNTITISSPENGEFANETYFITEGNWLKHLRITPFPALDWVILCTDGGAALAMQSDKELRPGFVFPMMERVFTQYGTQGRNAALESVLTDPQADKATTDDKTIVVACRSDLVGQIRDFASRYVTAPNNDLKTVSRQDENIAQPHPTQSNNKQRRQQQSTETHNQEKTRSPFAIITAPILAVIALLAAIAFFVAFYFSSAIAIWCTPDTEQKSDETPAIRRPQDEEAPKDQIKPKPIEGLGDDAHQVPQRKATTNSSSPPNPTSRSGATNKPPH